MNRNFVLLIFITVSLVIAQQGTKILNSQISNSLIITRNEIPQSSSTGTWTLKNTPSSLGVACYRNGLRQSPGLDFNIVGNTITSSIWLTTDTLLCDY